MSFHLLSSVAALLLIAFVFSALDGKRKFFHLIFISHSYPHRETSKKNQDIQGSINLISYEHCSRSSSTRSYLTIVLGGFKKFEVLSS